MKILDNQHILITGGTGSFGKQFVAKTLQHFNPKRLIVFSRDEMKQWEMAQSYRNDSRVRFFIGDIRDKNRLRRALDGVDIVVHAAATKIVPTAEYNPIECIKTNIMGAINLIDVCIDNQVQKVVSLSTDKACSPTNLYGATKLAADKLFIAANKYKGSNITKFSIVRYGNVMGSRGSVLPFFLQQVKEGFLSVTDPNMTRFMIQYDQAVELVWKAVRLQLGGEIFVPKIPSVKISTIAEAIISKKHHKVIGKRPGEKTHEELITEEEAHYTYEYNDHYIILPSIFSFDKYIKHTHDARKTPENFRYVSNVNNLWLSSEDIHAWIKKYDFN